MSIYNIRKIKKKKVCVIHMHFCDIILLLCLPQGKMNERKEYHCKTRLLKDSCRKENVFLDVWKFEYNDFTFGFTR